MAISTGPIQLEGKVGGLIFYRRGDKICCRSMPQYKPGSMTPASKQSAREFGKASKAGKLFRNALNGLWPMPQDSGMVNRLNKVLYSALRQDAMHKRGQRTITPATLQEALKGFRFNNRASLHFQVSTIRKANGHIQVALPENWLRLQKHPRFASHVQVQVAALAIDFETGACRKVAAVSECIALNAIHAKVALDMQLQVKGNASTIVVLQVRYIKEEANGIVYTSGDMAYMHSCVVGVFTQEKQPKTSIPKTQVVRNISTKPFTVPKPGKERLQKVTPQRKRLRITSS